MWICDQCGEEVDIFVFEKYIEHWDGDKMGGHKNIEKRDVYEI